MTIVGITVREGSPAHAGIDRRVKTGQVWGKRFPRTRGDRPYLSKSPSAVELVPPHTRG